MRTMRRCDRQTSPEEAWKILENADYMTLSMHGADGAPYGVSLSFVRVGSALYFHCAREGYKLESLRKDPAVCVTAVERQRTLAEAFSVAYRSTVAFGAARRRVGPALRPRREIRLRIAGRLGVLILVFLRGG